MAQAINAPLNVQVQNGRQLTQQVQASLNAVRLNLGNGKALSSLSQPLGRLTGQADEFTKSLDAANARVLAFGASVGIVNAFSNAFKSLVNSTIEVEKAIKAISVVGDQFNGKTKQLTQGLFNVAKVTGQSFAEVSKAALEFSRQGQNVEETLRRTQDALILTRLTGLDAAKAVEGLTAAANGFTKAGLNTTQILNKLVAVDQAFAVSSADLIEGFNRSAAVAENAGVTFDELAGIITALQQKTSRGGAVIGNALKTIFTRLQDTSTLNQLQGLGIAVQDLQGNLLPARQILQNLAKDVEGLGQITKAGIFKDVAGAFQINQLISLVSDLNSQNSIAADATRKSTGATNEAFLANEKLSQSLDAIINKVSLTGQQLGSLIGELGLADSFKSILSGINGFLEGATDLLQGDDLGAKFAKGIVKGIGAVLTGPGLGIFLAVIGKLTLDLVKFGSQSIKAFFGIGQAAKQQQQIQESIVQTLLRNENVLRTILNTQGGQNAQAQAFLGILNQQEKALQSIRSLAGGIAAPVIAAGYGVGSEGGIQRRGRAAGGYLPAQEASDVRRGVGGASPNSKVVSIPNFAFGGGKRGTMIANTSEYIVPNYAGGGSAIFNQDMVKTMGLPAGAKKIGAASGYVPNFANFNVQTRKKRKEKDANIINDIKIGGMSPSAYLTLGSGARTNAGKFRDLQTTAQEILQQRLGPISQSAKIEGSGIEFINLNRLQSTYLSGGELVSDITDLRLNINSGQVNKSDLGQRLRNIANKILPQTPGKLDDGLREQLESEIFSTSQAKFSAGNIFEQVLVKTVSGQLAEKNSKTWDLPKNMSAAFKKRFGIGSEFGDIKLGISPSSVSSFIGKHIINPTGDNKSSASNGYIPNFADSNFTNDQLGVLGLYGSNEPINGSPVYTFESNRPEFYKDIKSGYQKRITGFVNSYSKQIASKIGGGFQVSPKAVIKSLDSTDRISGFIFEDVMNQLAGPNFDTNRVSGNVRIDFPMTSNLREVFGVTGAQRFAEVKLTPQEQISSVIEKQQALARALATGGYTPKETDSKLIEELRKEAIEVEFGKGGRPKIELKDRKKAFIQKMRSSGLLTQTYLGQGADETNAIKKVLGLASTGYIPNFAASALQEAIAREKNAGLSSSQIYVDQSSALKSASNPMGLMVANTRDEPSGGFQGIARARREGSNPKTYGASKGFVPNFAPPAPVGTGPNDPFTGALPKSIANNAQKLQEFAKLIDDINKKLSKNKITQDEANKKLEQFVTGIKAGSQNLNPTKGKGLQAVQAAQSQLISPQEKVASGFGDVAGKVFLAQSALAFFNGAIEDTENSFAKLTAQITTSIGNIASLGLIGSQIASMNPTTAFGGFIKGLGLAGIGAAGIYEGFKLLDFGIKEFSGENAKAALASAKLAEASDKLSVKFDSLSKVRQNELTTQASKILGESGFKSLIGSIFGSEKGGGEIGGNVDVQKAVAQLSALGASETDIKKILEGSRKFSKQTIGVYGGTGSREVVTDVTQVSDVVSGLEEALSSGLGKTLNTQFKSFETALSGIDLTKAGGAAYTVGAKAYGKEKFSELNPEQQKLVKERVKQEIELNKEKSLQIQADQKIALGEKVSVELAKLKLDTLIEQKKAAIDLNTVQGTDSLRFQLETLDVSESYRNELEKQIKVKEIEAELSKTNLGLVSAVIDKLSSLPSDSVLGVSADQFKTIASELEDLDIKSVKDLDNAIFEIGGGLSLTKDQLQNILDLYREQFNQAQKNADAQKLSITNAADFTRRVIDSKNALESARLLTEKIASDLERAGRVRISVEEVQIGSLENQAKLLRERASATTNTSEQRGLNNAAIALDKKINDARATSAEKTYQSEKKAAELRRNTAAGELMRIQNAKDFLNNPQYDKNQIEAAKKAYADVEAELRILDNTQQKTRESFTATNESLDLQAQAIYRLTSATDAYRNTLLQFREGAGERIGAADISILSATDPTSLATATIQRKVEMEALNKGLQGEDYYKSVIQGTELEKKRFELSTETSKVRKIELERELKLMEDIANISAATDEERLTKIKEIIAARQQEARTFGSGFTQGVADLSDKTQNFKNEIGREIPNLFASNLAQGLNDAISGAKSLKDALRDAATSFLNALTQKNVENLAGLFTSGVGSFFTQKASGGMINGGSGVKDDVPAMLMGGEYVIRKSAVKKYGSKFLDSLNNGGIKAFAKGGGVQSGRGGFYVPGDYGEGAITGKGQLLAFAGQSFTGGQYDQVGVSGMSGASINLESESARLTAFGRENSPMFERIQQAKEEAFNVYLNQLKQEQQYREQLKQIEEAEKARKKQLTTAIISAVASSALSYAGSAFASGASNAVGSATAQAAQQGTTLGTLSKIGIGLKGGLGFGGMTGQGGLGNLFSGNFSSAFNNVSAMGGASVQGYSKPDYSGGVFRSGTYDYDSSLGMYGRVGKASGGMISGGSGIRDDVPAMLTGGEFVLNNRATRKLGVENLNRLNSGDVGGNSGQQVSEAVISKLDELIKTTRESSKNNVVVNVSGMEGGMENKEKRADENKSNTEKELQRKIRDAVLAVLAQEKRLGGSLSK
jgi:TP901 family phage tail tape measure protein